ncbi:host attachment protein, partial [Hyphomicrobium sp.]
AAPRALGMIRPVYSPRLRQAIVREVTKDMVKQPIHEIERFVTSEM